MRDRLSYLQDTPYRSLDTLTDWFLEHPKGVAVIITATPYAA